VLTLKSEFDQGKRALPNPAHRKLTYKMKVLKEKIIGVVEEIEETKKKLKRCRNKENKDKVSLILEYNIKIYKEQKKLFRCLVNERRKISYAQPNDPNFKKLTYVRYADD